MFCLLRYHSRRFFEDLLIKNIWWKLDKLVIFKTPIWTADKLKIYYKNLIIFFGTFLRLSHIRYKTIFSDLYKTSIYIKNPNKIYAILIRRNSSNFFWILNYFSWSKLRIFHLFFYKQANVSGTWQIWLSSFTI